MNREDILALYDVDPSGPINLLADERILRAHAGWIANESISGNPRYPWRPCGEERQLPDDIEIEGATLRLRSFADEPAVWEYPDGRVVLVCDANGPVLIQAGHSAT